MQVGRYNRWAAVAAPILAALIASHAQAQDRFTDEGGGVIIIQSGQAAVSYEDTLPTPSALRAMTVDSEVRLLVMQLDADEYEARQRATQALMESSKADVQLYAVLEQGGLSAEQRHRVLNVIRERVGNAPRGALGIRMDLQAARQLAAPGNVPGRPDVDPLPAVRITELIPGMPAERMLRINDQITHVDGHRVQTPEDLVVHIQSRRPGEVVTLTVLRPQQHGALDNGDDGAELAVNVDVPLGSVEGLHDPQTGAPPPPTRVDIERRREVAAVEQRYDTAVRVLEVLPEPR